MKLEHFFNRHPVFTGDELAAFLASEGPRNVRTVISGSDPANL